MTLKDGSQVAGYFGLGSYASSDGIDRDLYIESVYVVSDTGPWTEVPLNAGILIRGDQIKHIEFMRFRVE